MCCCRLSRHGLASMSAETASNPQVEDRITPHRKAVMLPPRVLPMLVALVAIGAIACGGATGKPTVTPSPAAHDPVTPLQPTAEATPASQRAAPAVPVSRQPSGTRNVPARLVIGWGNTDFSKHSVPFFEIISGGVGRDGIPPIDDPVFLNASDDPEYMEDDDPVIALEVEGEAKAYPLDVLQWHEIVNDELGGVPVTVTYCPLCNTAVVFDRRVDGRVFDFGVSGNLRNSDLIMWDRQTESWWQQITGESIVGEMTGTKLEVIPAPIVSWIDFRETFPSGRLLSRRTRSYDNAPYDGYDDLANTSPFLFLTEDDQEGIRGGEGREEVISRKIDSRLRPMERVVSLSIDGHAVAYPFTMLREMPVVNDSIGGQDIVVFYVGGTLSAFEGAGGASNRIVGSTGVYDPFVNGEKLTFGVEDRKIVDESTGSRWNILGRATEGPLAGTELRPVAHTNHFWFAWAAFNPDTDVREVGDVSR